MGNDPALQILVACGGQFLHDGTFKSLPGGQFGRGKRAQRH
jgi:hypothetical protein